MRHDNFIPQPRLAELRTRGHLPHWLTNDSIYFVTFRLKDSLPLEVTKRLHFERMSALRAAQGSAERAQLDRAFSLRLDTELDLGRGSCLLAEHAEVVASSLKHFDGQRYDLHAWCVMPNHVHVLFYLENGTDLPGIVQAWKSYTAHVIGRGVIWQREYFDRVIRTPEEYRETQRYIWRNPQKAGLAGWKWVG